MTPKQKQQAIFQGSFLAWVHESKITLDGRPFTFKGHEYLVDIYKDKAAHKLFKKAAQMGFSTYCMLSSIHGCCYAYPLGVLYLLATRTDVSEFSRGRFTKLMAENPRLQRLVAETDSINLKRIGHAHLYFRGTKTTTSLKTIPVDKVVVDELDEHDPKMVGLALQRMGHSEMKHRDDLSTPSIPDYGIDLQWQASDQKQWFIKCEHCGKWNCLEDTFPGCLQEENGVVVKVCQHCGDQVHSYNGQWVAKHPSEKRISGYWISQLNSVYVAPASILEAYRIHVLRRGIPPGGKYDPGLFYNSQLGMAWVDAHDRLEKETVFACCDEQIPNATSHLEACSMGVDQGADIHVVIGTGQGRIVHLGVYRNWEELDGLIKRFNVQCCVVDALPETRNARALQGRHPGRVWLFYYNEHQKGSYRWDEGERIVQANRTESLDESHNQILRQEVVLPQRCSETEEFASHCHNTAKKLVEDDKGNKRYVYVKLGADHYRHAFNYECIARTNLGVGMDQVIVGKPRVSTQADWPDGNLPDYF